MKFLKLLPYNINSPWRGEGVMEFTITCLLTQRRLHTNFGKDWRSSS